MLSSGELLEKALQLQGLVIMCATGEGNDYSGYVSLRRELMATASIRELLPKFIMNCRDLDQFWAFIKPEFPTYQQRRNFIWSEFNPLVETLEREPLCPSDEPVSEVLSKFDADHVHQLWLKALDRRTYDPEGAITSARTLLEAVCKRILDEVGEKYDEGLELPKLYTLVAKQLNLAPSQHTEQVFKQILGNCQAVVEGLGAVRNRLGDAHGKGKAPVKPASRHAELAVNLAGTMATFLVATWDACREE
jgi:hypothetical protein